jgi:acetyltransferase
MIAIRKLEARDRESFQAFIRELSGESRVNRFLAPVQELAPAVLGVLTQPDQARHVALVAVEGDRIIAEGRYVTLEDGRRGEFAIAVADERQRQGIGSRMLGVLMAAARRAGLAILEGDVLRSNAPMLGLMRRAGFRLKPAPGNAGIVVAECELGRTSMAA